MNNGDLHFDFIASSEVEAGRNYLKICGWAISIYEVYKIKVQVKEEVFSCPVGLPRPDVHQVMNCKNIYTFENSFFSGFSKNLYISDSLDASDTMTIAVKIVNRLDESFFSMELVIKNGGEVRKFI